MNRKRVIIGVGQCGMKLASEYFNNFQKTSNAILNFSTSVEDSTNVIRSGLVQVFKDGSGKRYSSGENIWRNNLGLLESSLNSVRDSDIIYFTSAGGGSGSSSIKFVTDILLKNRNRVILVLVLPFDYEMLPYKPNAIRVLSLLQDEKYYDKISILLFDNDKLSKEYYITEKDEKTFPDINKINKYIVTTVNIMVDLVDEYHYVNKYTPFSIDRLEHESVVFSKGFMGIDFIKYENSENNTVKFDYGSLSDCKNVIVAKVIGLKETDYIVNQNVGKFMDSVKSISKKAKNARIISGIIRTDKIENSTYIIIGNNLDITKYVERIKSKVSYRIENFKREDEKARVLQENEISIYDV